MNRLATLNTALEATHSLDDESEQMLTLFGRPEGREHTLRPRYSAVSRRRDRARRS